MKTGVDTFCELWAFFFPWHCFYIIEIPCFSGAFKLFFNTRCRCLSKCPQHCQQCEARLFKCDFFLYETMTDWPNKIQLLVDSLKMTQSKETNADPQSSAQLTVLLQGWNQLLPGRFPPKFGIFNVWSIIPWSSKLLLPIRPTNVWNLCPGNENTR